MKSFFSLFLLFLITSCDLPTDRLDLLNGRLSELSDHINVISNSFTKTANKLDKEIKSEILTELEKLKRDKDTYVITIKALSERIAKLESLVIGSDVEDINGLLFELTKLKNELLVFKKEVDEEENKINVSESEEDSQKPETTSPSTSP